MHVRVGPGARAIALRITPKVTVTGRIILEGFETQQPPSISLSSGVPEYYSGLSEPMGELSDAGFDVSPGSYQVQTNSEVYDGLYVASVLQDGREINGGKIPIPEGHATDLEVHLRKSTAAIEVKLPADSPPDPEGEFFWAIPGDD